MMKMEYAKNEQTFRNVAVLIAALSLLLLLAGSTAYALYSYGYKIGDKYDFNMQTTSTTDTPSGKAGSSTSYGVAFTIRDIREDYNSHRIDIKYLAVISTGGITGLGGSDIISEGHMEGDPRPFIGGSTLGFPSSPFITTDWELRGIEWQTYVENNYGNKPGYLIKSNTHSNGLFALDIDLDVDQARSEYDFNNDGTPDAYTGTLSVKIEYDSNGILSSASMKSNIQAAGEKGSLDYSMSAGRGQAALGGGLPADTFTYTLAITGVIIAFIIGFIVHMMMTPRKTAMSQPSPSQSSQSS
jgi:hypothetical protein